MSSFPHVCGGNDKKLMELILSKYHCILILIVCADVRFIHFEFPSNGAFCQTIVTFRQALNC
jgi:hypothetical protein